MGVSVIERGVSMGRGIVRVLVGDRDEVEVGWAWERWGSDGMGWDGIARNGRWGNVTRLTGRNLQ